MPLRMDYESESYRCRAMYIRTRSCYRVPLSSMYSQRHKSRRELQVHQMLWMGACEMFWNLKCSPVSEKRLLDMRHLLGPIVPAITTTTLSPAPPTGQISDDSTFNVLQLNAYGIANRLTELGVVLERNKVKVAVIQE